MEELRWDANVGSIFGVLMATGAIGNQLSLTYRHIAIEGNASGDQRRPLLWRWLHAKWPSETEPTRPDKASDNSRIQPNSRPRHWSSWTERPPKWLLHFGRRRVLRRTCRYLIGNYTKWKVQRSTNAWTGLTRWYVSRSASNTFHMPKICNKQSPTSSDTEPAMDPKGS